MSALEKRVRRVVATSPGIVTNSVIRRLRPHAPPTVEATLRRLERDGVLRRVGLGWRRA